MRAAAGTAATPTPRKSSLAPRVAPSPRPAPAPVKPPLRTSAVRDRSPAAISPSSASANPADDHGAIRRVTSSTENKAKPTPTSAPRRASHRVGPPATTNLVDDPVKKLATPATSVGGRPSSATRTPVTRSPRTPVVPGRRTPSPGQASSTTPRSRDSVSKAPKISNSEPAMLVDDIGVPMPNESVVELERENRDLRRELESTSQKLQLAKTELDQVNREVSRLEADAKEGSERAREASSKANKLESQLKSEREKRESLEQDLENARIDLEALKIDMEELTLEKEVLQDDLENAQAEAKEALDDVAAQTTLVEDLKRKLAQLQPEDNKPKESGEDLVTMLQEQVSRYKEALRRAMAEYRQEQAKNQRYESTLKSEERHVEIAQQKVAMLQDLMPQLEQTRRENNELKERLDQAQENERTIQRLQEKLTARESKIADLEKTVEDSEALVNETYQMFDEMEEWYTDSRAEVQHLDEQLALISERYDSTLAELQTLRLQESRYQAALQAAHQQIRRYKQVTKKLERSDTIQELDAEEPLQVGRPGHRLDFEAQALALIRTHELNRVYDALLGDTDFDQDKQALRFVLTCCAVVDKAQTAADHLERTYVLNANPKLLAEDIPLTATLALALRGIQHASEELRQWCSRCEYKHLLQITAKHKADLTGCDEVLDHVLADLNDDNVKTGHRLSTQLYNTEQLIATMLRQAPQLSVPELSVANSYVHSRAPFMHPTWPLHILSDVLLLTVGAIQMDLKRIHTALELIFDEQDGQEFRDCLQNKRKLETVSLVFAAMKDARQRANESSLVVRNFAARAKSVAVVPLAQTIHEAQGCVGLLTRIREEVNKVGDAFTKVESDLTAAECTDILVTHVPDLSTLVRASGPGSNTAVGSIVEALSSTATILESVSTTLVNGELVQCQPAQDRGDWLSWMPINQRVRMVRALLSEASEKDEQLQKALLSLKSTKTALAQATIQLRDLEVRAETAEKKLQGHRLTSEEALGSSQQLTEARKEVDQLKARLDDKQAQLNELEEENTVLRNKKGGGPLQPGELNAIIASGDAQAKEMLGKVLEPMQNEIDDLRAALLFVNQSHLLRSATFVKALRIDSDALRRFEPTVPILQQLQKHVRHVVAANTNALSKVLESQLVKEPAPSASAAVSPLSDEGIKQELATVLHDLSKLLREIETLRTKPSVASATGPSGWKGAAQEIKQQRKREAELNSLALVLQARAETLMAQINPCRVVVTPLNIFKTNAASTAAPPLGESPMLKKVARITVGAPAVDTAVTKLTVQNDSLAALCKAFVTRG